MNKKYFRGTAAALYVFLKQCAEASFFICGHSAGIPACQPRKFSGLPPVNRLLEVQQGRGSPALSCSYRGAEYTPVSSLHFPTVSIQHPGTLIPNLFNRDRGLPLRELSLLKDCLY